jgi:hypothetical protein
MLNPNHPRYCTRERVRGWSVPVSPLFVPKLLKRRVSWTRTERWALAAEYDRSAAHAEAIYSDLLDVAALATWGRKYRHTDYHISGIASDEFSDAFKNALRFWARRIGECKGVAWTLRKVRG